jgi:PKD repeat protein
MYTRHSIFFALLSAVVLLATGCDSGGVSGDLVVSFERIETSELSVEFVDRSRNPGGSIASRSWDFGDGSSGSGANPSHTYDEQGTYTVTLTAEGSGGETTSTSRDINVGVPGTQQFEVTIENVGDLLPLTKSGTFEGPSSGPLAGPTIDPGQEADFSFSIGPEELPGTGAVLSFASMFIQSNDAFYAFQPEGIPLFRESGAPRGQDGPVNVTGSVGLWDAGTEVDEEPGNGADQPPSSGGTDEGGQIAQIVDLDDDDLLEDPPRHPDEADTLEYPAVLDVLEVRIESEEDETSGGYKFTVTIENVTDETGTQVNGEDISLSPGTRAAHFDQVPGGDPFENLEDDVRYPGFIRIDSTDELGEPVAYDSTASDGLELLAEDGDPSDHFNNEIDPLTGITVPVSPGAFAAHSEAIKPFSLNREASSGIESIAEDGDPSTLAETLGGAGAVTNGGVFGEGPLPPVAEGDSMISFTVFAAEPDPEEDFEGDRLSIATMHIQSNDYFYAFDPAGLPLFDENGNPIDGNVTDELSLYDAQTEQDQEIGVGINQAPRQPSPDTGPSESGTVNRKTRLPANDDLVDVIEVTVTPVAP